MILPSTAKKSRHGPSGKISMEPLIQQRTSRAADDDALFSISSSASTKQHKLKKGSLVMLSNVKGGKRSKQRKDCVSLDGGSVHSTASFASKMSVQSAPMATGPIKIEGSATKRRKSKKPNELISETKQARTKTRNHRGQRRIQHVPKAEHRSPKDIAPRLKVFLWKTRPRMKLLVFDSKEDLQERFLLRPFARRNPAIGQDIGTRKRK